MMYIVEITIDRNRHADWEEWMRHTHIPDVMATGCFRHAVLTRDADSDTDDRVGYRVLYQAHSRSAFERYEEQDAESLQREHTARFEGAFEASRALLPVVQEFS